MLLSVVTLMSLHIQCHAVEKFSCFVLSVFVFSPLVFLFLRYDVLLQILLAPSEIFVMPIVSGDPSSWRCSVSGDSRVLFDFSSQQDMKPVLKIEIIGSCGYRKGLILLRQEFLSEKICVTSSDASISTLNTGFVFCCEGKIEQEILHPFRSMKTGNWQTFCS